MGSEDWDVRSAMPDDILSLCRAYDAADRRRCEIERSLAGLPEGDDGRERLWQVLDAVTDELSDAARRLADTQSGSVEDLKAKAGVLERVLLAAAGDVSLLGPDDLRLALGIAQEAIRLL